MELTEKEQEVYELLCDGRLNYGDIRHGLQMSRNTLKYHIGNILSKVGVKNRAELIWRHYNE